MAWLTVIPAEIVLGFDKIRTNAHCVKGQVAHRSFASRASHHRRASICCTCGFQAKAIKTFASNRNLPTNHYSSSRACFTSSIVNVGESGGACTMGKPFRTSKGAASLALPRSSRTSISKGSSMGKSTGTSGTSTRPSKCARRVIMHKVYRVALVYPMRICHPGSSTPKLAASSS